ncbi:hypothetical protein [Sporosarcina sp. G11-34]|uniref:hypothetical protein n=1 Tax=Sporosarcina sp. G11-34 TaxID=2849605 RepID=UPI0022A95762|nr:hypothetical protein [Sporosarcina sp. G11-34]MCZ2259938.1 hypothetical protein [Sporosarcina sp. G11-34]
MIQVIIGATFLLMSAILYGANVISVSIVGEQSEVGYLPIIISVITGFMGLMLLLMKERDLNDGTKELEKIVRDSGLDN